MRIKNSQHNKSYYLEKYELKAKNKKVIASGISIGHKIAHGKARVIIDKKNTPSFKSGEILITNLTEPDWEPLFKKAKAVIVDSGNRTAHIAIVAREMGIPAIVGTEIGTQSIKTGQNITVDCSTQGSTGLVYDGSLRFTKKIINLKNLPKTSCKILINTGEPSLSEDHAKLPADGVGLARLEFIINEHIKIHPLALLNTKTLQSQKTKKYIEKTIKENNYKTGRNFYINKLANGISEIAQAFYPREVTVRLSDFKSNEYQHLIGGSEFEPIEQNPMLGWRGASRYYDSKFKPAFAMECIAMKQAIERNRLDNIQLLVPFVRTIDEAKKIINQLKKHGLKKSKSLKIYMMAEIPSNVILAEKFLKYFDGFSIGTNDLTQLILGVDRSSAYLSHLYDERNEAVKLMIKDLIKKTHKHKKTVGICGQAPSDFPDFAKFLVKANIDSISVNPDSVLTTRLLVSKIK